mmetsp:Transcript_10099/g.32089  ORF Transcript_10099/g.32089 Transcript_10099/m.32089 type:complete len:213 (+) Transcript_10099:437-1075(+)
MPGMGPTNASGRRGRATSSERPFCRKQRNCGIGVGLWLAAWSSPSTMSGGSATPAYRESTRRVRWAISAVCPTGRPTKSGGACTPPLPVHSRRRGFRVRSFPPWRRSGTRRASWQRAAACRTRTLSSASGRPCPGTESSTTSPPSTTPGARARDRWGSLNGTRSGLYASRWCRLPGAVDPVRMSRSFRGGSRPIRSSWRTGLSRTRRGRSQP